LLLVSIVMVLGISELAYRLMKADSVRGPMTIELVIPADTAVRIAAGEAMPAIPEEMTFVVGDTLVVKNEDAVNHQLGPLYIPSGSSASLKMEKAESLFVDCSFQSTQYLGLTINQPVTWASRLQALGYGVPPTWMFLLVYSFAIRPLEKKSLDKAPLKPAQAAAQDEELPGRPEGV